jgi:hypothetical protein
MLSVLSRLSPRVNEGWWHGTALGTHHDACTSRVNQLSGIAGYDRNIGGVKWLVQRGWEVAASPPLCCWQGRVSVRAGRPFRD